MTVKRRGYNSNSDGKDRPFKISRTPAAIRLNTINNMALTSRSLEEELDYLLREPKAAIEDVLQQNPYTMMTAFFELCDGDSPESDMARGLLYHEMPVLHFVWGKFGSRYRWKPRVLDRYYIRLLLCYRRGPRSFKDLRTIDGEVLKSYKAAALAMGLLESDEENYS
ncbi:putative ATP-dependent DNA helicase [Phytophthora infestans]|uniref:Putative ATP-dependent DNA helicase n=1 Tax=Phytophthora infestans TaxID=4787 RepID=A0A833TF98_PHYIN|nr:putative ATP-dependent DNA helicase [Phytophthora infestans]KAF4144260.1 putative ATP-dependent DNA helicase [Phytophthora infestans]